METVKVERFPVDYEALQKGDVITVERLEKITGKSHGTVAHQLGVLQLMGQIERDMWAANKRVTLKLDKGAIVVCTDSEAAIKNARDFMLGLRKLSRSHVRNQFVDVSQLADDERAAHERKLEVEGKYLQAVASTRKEIRLQSHSRSTPGLPSPQ